MMRLYFTRLKILTRDRINVFWTLLFPIILSSLFYLALGNAYTGEGFHSIKVALVENESYEYIEEFKSALINAKTSGNEDSMNLFEVMETKVEEAKTLLNDNEIIGYIQAGNTMNLVVKSSGIQQTIAKSFLKIYNQSFNTIENISKTNPQVLPQVLEDLNNSSNYLALNSIGNNPPDTMLNHYYALVAMACLFGSFWGLKEIVYIQGDLSWKGARVNVAPIHKMKMLLCNLLASLTIHFIGIIILLAYLILVLKVSFGNNLLYTILACLLACIYGISLGAMISTLTKKGEDFKSTVLAAIVMSSSFLAGLMIVDMKHIVTTKIPILQYLNPSSIITDAFYSLYYYENNSKFFLNITLMIAYSLLFNFIIYITVRRKRYESL